MKIILVSGISGSGKSTYVESVTTKASWICSADHFFMIGGKYNFNPAHLRDAHAACLRKFMACLQSWMVGSQPPCDVLVVDNTNLTALELAPYVAIATMYGLPCEIVTLRIDPEVAWLRNAHHVPHATVDRMHRTLQERKLPPFWYATMTDIAAT